MDAIRLADSNQLYLVIGGKTAASRLLELAAQLALRGPLLLLDCGNCAAPLPLARQLHRLTSNPVGVLERVHAARAFTCYQVVALLERTCASPSRRPVLVFNLLATFYDESVSYGEGRRLLAHCLELLRLVTATAPVAVNARRPPAEFPERAHFMDMLCSFADQVWVEEEDAPPTPCQPGLFG